MWECEFEIGAVFVLGFEIDHAIKSIYNQFTDYKTKADSFCMQFVFVFFDVAKQLKYFIHVFYFNTDSIVVDINFEFSNDW